MLSKLIKYEFKASGRLIPLVYVVVGLLAVAGVILSAVKAYVYMGVSLLLLFLASAAAMIITFVIIFIRFYQGLFGAEGYLTMTLPVSSTQVYLSKTIVAVCWLALSSLVSVAAWTLAMSSMFRTLFWEEEIPAYFFNEIFSWLREFFSPMVIVITLIGMVVGFLSFTAQVYFCVTLSNIKPFQGLGLGAAIISFVALQIVTQILSYALMVLVPFGLKFSPHGGWSFARTSMWEMMEGQYSSAVSIGLGSYLLAFLLAFGLPALTIWLIDHKVNVK